MAPKDPVGWLLFIVFILLVGLWIRTILRGRALYGTCPLCNQELKLVEGMLPSEHKNEGGSHCGNLKPVNLRRSPSRP